MEDFSVSGCIWSAIEGVFVTLSERKVRITATYSISWTHSIRYNIMKHSVQPLVTEFSKHHLH